MTKKKLHLIDYDGTVKNFDCDIDQIEKMRIEIVSGDEIAHVTYLDGTEEYFDSGEGRTENYFDKEYYVRKNELEKWISLESLRNSYERHDAFCEVK